MNQIVYYSTDREDGNFSFQLDQKYHSLILDEGNKNNE